MKEEKEEEAYERKQWAAEIANDFEVAESLAIILPPQK